MDKNKIWENFLNTISKNINSVSYNTWFKDAKLEKIDNNNLVIVVDNNFIKEQLINYYSDFIEETLESISDEHFTFDILTKDEVVKEEKVIIVEEPKETIEFDIPKYKNINSNLNKNYTFNNFVVGDSNRFAQTVALAVAENPGGMYNPLFIYGKSGIGKTHLMHAVGNYVVDNLNKSVLYVRAQDFMDEFTSLFRNNKDEEDNYILMEHFKEKYRSVDVLIIDDIQMLGGASKTQDEFFATFNELKDNGKQIIISSDRSPDDLQMLEDRLKTRFTWGITANIKPPELELKVKIIKNKIAFHEIAKEIEPAVFEYIANNAESDVRHIEGAINKLYAYIAIYSPPIINLEFAITSLADYWGKNNYIINSVGKIQKAVADYYNLTIENLKSKKRVSEINNARQIAMYICKMTTEETIERIGLEFNRDHATVLHACKVVEDRLKIDKELEEQIKEIKLKIAN